MSLPKKIKEPKKTLKAIENLHKIVDQLRFFYGSNGSKFKKEVLKDAIYIEDTIREYGVDKKIDHAKFAVKFKHLFNKENQELKKEVKELKEKVKERGKKIEKLIEVVKEKDETIET